MSACHLFHDLKKDKFLEDFGVRTPGDYLAKTFVDHTIQCLPKRRVLRILNFFGCVVIKLNSRYEFPCYP